MVINVAKVNNNIVSITTEITTTNTTQSSYDALLSKRDNLTQQIKNLQLSLDDTNNIISQAEKLGIKSTLATKDVGGLSGTSERISA